jgi:hypothetical protein
MTVNRAKAIDEMCKACIYDGNSGSGTWRKQVEDCTSYSCPLFVVRPVSQGKRADYTPTGRVPAHVFKKKEQNDGT